MKITETVKLIGRELKYKLSDVFDVLYLPPVKSFQKGRRENLIALLGLGTTAVVVGPTFAKKLLKDFVDSDKVDEFADLKSQLKSSPSYKDLASLYNSVLASDNNFKKGEKEKLKSFILDISLDFIERNKRNGFLGFSFAVPLQLNNVIVNISRIFKFTPNLTKLALGIAQTENGGKLNAQSGEKAKGIIQLTENTAKKLGSKDTFTKNEDYIDLRSNPFLNLALGITLINENYQIRRKALNPNGEPDAFLAKLLAVSAHVGPEMLSVAKETCVNERSDCSHTNIIETILRDSKEPDEHKQYPLRILANLTLFYAATTIGEYVQAEFAENINQHILSKKNLFELPIKSFNENAKKLSQLSKETLLKDYLEHQNSYVKAMNIDKLQEVIQDSRSIYEELEATPIALNEKFNIEKLPDIGKQFMRMLVGLEVLNRTLSEKIIEKVKIDNRAEFYLDLIAMCIDQSEKV